MNTRIMAVAKRLRGLAVAIMAFGLPGLPIARAQFTPDTLWASNQNGRIFEITLSRDAQGIPQSTGVSLFASNPSGLSPGVAFFNGELYYVSAGEGTIYRYQPDGSRIAYATGFSTDFFGITSLLFDDAGDLLLCETTQNFTGTIWSIPLGGGTVPFDVFLGNADVETPISLVRDPQTGTLYIADWLEGKIVARDTSGTVLLVATGLAEPAGLQIDCEGNLYVSEHSGARVTKIDPSGVASTLFAASQPEGIAADSFGFFYVGLNNGDVVRFDADGNPVVLEHVGGDLDQVVWFGGGNGPNTGTPTCLVDPSALLLALIDTVMNLNLQQGISNSLDAKLDVAAQALEDMNANNDAAACNTLQAFINAVQAQSGNQICEEDADALVAAVQQILDALGCS